MIISQTNVASVGSVFNDMRKVKVFSLPETIKEKSTFWFFYSLPETIKKKSTFPLLTPDEGPSLKTSIFPL